LNFCSKKTNIELVDFIDFSKKEAVMKVALRIIIIVCLVVSFSGCARLRKARRADELEKQVVALQEKLDECREDKEREVSKLERVKRLLEDRLENQLSEYKAKIEMTDRGLVVTFLSEIFFDSGKDKIKDSARDILNEVAAVLQNEVSELSVAIEGHTDNVPIKYSGWKSNWELASARALSVLHYFTDECGIDPMRLSANSYGEFRPSVDNSTAEGKQQNRRVEIIILSPENIKKKGYTSTYK